MDVAVRFSGGDHLKRKLAQMAAGLDKAKSVRVGFLEGSTYPANDGSRLADAARRVTPDVESAHPDWKPRLTAWARWSQSHTPEIGIPQAAFWLEFGTTTQKPFPFFRSSIRNNSSNWGGALGRYLKSSEYDAGRALAKMGVLIQGQILDSLEAGPADNAQLTVFVKGFSKRGQDTGQMKRHVDFEVRQ